MDFLLFVIILSVLIPRSHATLKMHAARDSARTCLVGPFNPYNTTSVKSYENCFQYIIDTYGLDVQYYSTYNAQRDLLGAIQAIDPEVVHIYAQSFGTYAINTYLQLPGARADVVVLDGPVPPNRWPLENNGGRPIT